MGGSVELVALGMPVYNRADTLPEVLKSILGLDYPKEKLRLIFVDNCSTDGSYELLIRFKSEHGDEFESITVVRRRGNIPFARNLCISLSGDASLILFLDSDVKLRPWTLRKLLKLMEQADIIASYYNGDKPTHVRAKGPKYVSNVGMGCTLIKREVIQAIGGFDEGLPVGEDTDFCLRASEAGFRIILDDSEVLEHLGKPRRGPLSLLADSKRKRRVYAKLLARRLYRRRLLLYLLLDISIGLAWLSPLLLLPILAYLALQLSRRRGIAWALSSTLNAIILPPIALIGLLENHLKDRSKNKIN